MEPSSPQHGAKKHRRVLVIRLSSLGDVVMASSVLAPLHEQGFEVDFLVKEAFAGLLKGHQKVAELRVFQKSGASEFKNAKDLQEWSRERNHDLVIDLQNSWRTWFWRTFWRSGQHQPPWLVLPKQRVRELLVLMFKWRGLGWGRGGRAAAMRALVENNLGSPPSKEPLTTLEQGFTEVDAVLKEPYWVLVPHSAWNSKEWQGFQRLAQEVAVRYQVRIVLMGSSKDYKCDAIADALVKMGHKALSLRGKTDLLAAKSVLAGAQRVVGNDTGLLHMAEALGRPVLMIEGPTHSSLGFSAYRKDSALAGKELWCRPCSKSGSFCWRWGSRACLNSLSVEEVLEAIPPLNAKGGKGEG